MKRDRASRSRDRATTAALVLAVLAASIVHLAGAVKVYDDAYITYRYVENIHQGRGAVFNEGERVLGVSSPLYLLWLSILRSVLPGLELPVLAVTGNLIFLLAACLLIVATLRGLGPGKRAGMIAVIAVILSGPILRVSMGGMEMSIFLALIFATILLLQQDRRAAALWTASLAALTRPEGSILVGMVLLSFFLAKDRKLSRLAGLLPLGIWVAWSVWYYGTPVPHSVIAKAQPLYPLPAGTALLELIRQMGAWSVEGILTGVGLITSKPRPGGTAMAAALPLIGLVATGWILLRWRRVAGTPGEAGRWALPVFFCAMVAFYAVGNPLIFAWYYPPFQACWIVMAVAAGLSPGGGRRDRIIGGSVLGLVLLTAISSFASALGPSDANILEHGAVGRLRFEMMASYARAADWVETHSDPADRVAAPEIGMLGWELDRKILDACGLVSPEAIPFLPVPPEQSGGRQGAISTDFVKATRPEWVVTNPLHAMHSLLASRWFLDEYEEVHRDFADIDGPALAVLVFRKRP